MQSPFIWIFAFLRHFVVYFRQFDTSKPSGTEIDEVFLETGRQGDKEYRTLLQEQNSKGLTYVLNYLNYLTPCLLN